MGFCVLGAAANMKAYKHDKVVLSPQMGNDQASFAEHISTVVYPGPSGERGERVEFDISTGLSLHSRAIQSRCKHRRIPVEVQRQPWSTVALSLLDALEHAPVSRASVPF